jgi:hypothetical protein
VGSSNNTGRALEVEDSDNSNLLYVNNAGEVVISKNYLYVNNNGGIYSNGSIKARGGITNDGGNNLSISSGGSAITFNSKNFTSVGTISSGSITATGNSSIDRITLKASSGSGTGGGRLLDGYYSGDDHLWTLSSDKSSGALTIGYGADSATSGAEGFDSTFDNFNGKRSAVTFRSDSVKFWGTSAAVQTAVGSSLTTMANRITLHTDNGEAEFDGAVTTNRLNITNSTAPYITFTEGSDVVHAGVDGGAFWIRTNGIGGGDEFRVNSDGTIVISHATTFSSNITAQGISTFNSLRLTDTSKMGFGTVKAGGTVGHSASTEEGIFWHTAADYGIYRTAGSWSSPDYQQLKLRWATGIQLDGGTAYGKSGVDLVNSTDLLVNGNVVIDGGTNLIIKDRLPNTVFKDRGAAPSNLNDAGMGVWRINTGHTNQPSTNFNYGTLISFDNSSDTGFQIAAAYNNTKDLRFRGGNSSVYGGSGSFQNWERIYHDAYHPNADRWTTGRTHTVTLTGQVTGTASQTVDGSGNKTWSIATALNDSALNDQYVQVLPRHQDDGDSLIVASRASITIWDVSEASDDPSGASDGLVLSAGWDSSSWGIQQYHDFHTNDLYLRSKQNGTMSSWDKVFHDTYHPNADKWTTARNLTVTLTGSIVTGTATQSVDGSANKTWSIATGVNEVNLGETLFNNKGQTHSTYTNFNTVMTPGPNYIQSHTNGPESSGQWYGFMLGLGSQYGTSTGSNGHYAMQMYTKRNASENDQYLYMRSMEGGNWADWRKVTAGAADRWKTARTLSLAGDLSGNVSINGTSNVTLVATVADNSHNHTNYVSKSGDTMTGRLNFADEGYSMNNELHVWKRSYSVSISSPQDLLYHDGNALPNGGAYRVQAHISGTGTDQSATAVFWNENGTWKVNATYQSGTSSNHPEFKVGSNGKPQIQIDHSTAYTIHILHERLELNEGTGTDNKSGFGADGYMSEVLGVLRHNPNGGTDHTAGNQVFTDAYHPNADALTTARTINGVSFNGTQNITIADSTKVSKTGDTMTGQLTMSGESPQIKFTDNTTNHTDFWIHVNSDRFYVLPDRDSSGGWETDYALELNADTDVGYVFGERIFNNGYHPNADKWTTARTLTLSGMVSGSVSWDGSGNATLNTVSNHIRSLGTQAFTGGSNPNITTAQLISEMESDGAFDSYSSVFKTSWSYAGNYDLSDAGRFTETAGTSWLTWTDNSSDTTRGNITALAVAPNTGGSAGKVFIYNDQGSGYAPGWREVWTSTSDGPGSGLNADLLDGLHESSFMRKTANSSLDMANREIYGVNNLRFYDPGKNEGIKWDGGSLWQIYESPDARDNAAGNLQFTSGSGDGTRRMTIRTDGRVTIPSGGLSVGTDNTSNKLMVSDGTQGFEVNPNSGGEVRINAYDRTNSAFKIMRVKSSAFYWENGTTIRFSVDGSGNGIFEGNVTAYGSASDIRLKENVEVIPDALDKVKKLDGVTFNYKKDGSRSTGLIAQQLQEVLDEAVYETSDAEGNETHLAIRYGNVVGLLVEAMKEQSAQIETLTKRIEELENGNH